MPDKVFLAALLADVVFLASALLQLGCSLFLMHEARTATSRDGKHAIRHLLAQQFPLAASLANAALVLAVVALTVPGLLSAGRTRLLRAGAYAVAACGLFHMVLGLDVWFSTLRVKESFAPTYYAQPAHTQSLVQSSFHCCGYWNASAPAFVTDGVCSSPAAAALARGCSSFVADYANNYTVLVFTALFGMVGVDVLLVLAIACLLQTRKERERYRLIREKSGYGHF